MGTDLELVLLCFGADTVELTFPARLKMRIFQRESHVYKPNFAPFVLSVIRYIFFVASCGVVVSKVDSH